MLRHWSQLVPKMSAEDIKHHFIIIIMQQMFSSSDANTQHVVYRQSNNKTNKVTESRQQFLIQSNNKPSKLMESHPATIPFHQLLHIQN